MPPTRDHIRATAEEYLARHPQEREALAGLMSVLESADAPASRSTLPGHVTCSAAVIDRQRRVLHIGHKVSRKLLCPGGHVEDDRTLLAAALREVCEETGLRPQDLCLTPQFLSAPADIDTHDIDANPRKDERQHQHFDFRFVFCLATPHHPPLALQDEEVNDAQWLPLADVRSPTLRAKLLAAELEGLDGQPEPVNASALIHNGNGSYLLHLRDDVSDIWQPWVLALVGGGRERGDQTLEHTVRRELAEEIPGLHVEDLAPYTVEKETSTEGLHTPVAVFSGRWNGNPDRLTLHEGVLLRWFTPGQLDRLRLSPGLADLIRRHAADCTSEAAPAGPPAAWGVGHRTVLNGIGVHLHLEDEDGRVLLGLRHPDSVFAGNTWHYLAGKCEQESAVTCLVREAREEAGLIIDPADVELVHLVHLVDTPGRPPLMQLVFQARRWKGAPELLEPDKCLAWQWWDPAHLPAQVVDYTRAAVEGIVAGRRYTELGWVRHEVAPDK